MLRIWLVFIGLFLLEIIRSVWFAILKEIVRLAIMVLSLTAFLISLLTVLIMFEIIITFFLKKIFF